MTSAIVHAFICALLALSAAQGPDACGAHEGYCEVESSTLLQTSSWQRTINSGGDYQIDPKPDPTDEHPCWRGRMTTAQYKKCMASVPLDSTVRDCTLAVLKHSLSDVYAFTGIIQDSLNNSAELAAGYDFEEYDVKLRPYIQSLWPRLQTEEAAGTFAIELLTLTNKLRDAHTYVRPRLLYNNVRSVPPITVRAEAQHGQTIFRIEEGIGALADVVGKVVRTINNVSAIDYFTEAAFVKGSGVKDTSVAINLYLWDQSVQGVLPPQDGQMNIVLTDGTEIDSEWTVHFDVEGLCSETEVFQGVCRKSHHEVLVPRLTYNHVFAQLAEAFTRNGMDLPCGPEPGCPMLSDVLSANPSYSLLEDPGSEGSRESLLAETATNRDFVSELHESVDIKLASSTPVVELWPVLDYPKAGCYPVVIEDKIKETSVCSLKITQFPSGMDGLRELQACAVAAVELAEQQCDGNLLLDVLGGFGGDSVAGYWLNYYLFSNHPSKPFKRPVDVCEWYQFPKFKIMDQLVDAAQRGTPKLVEQSEPVNFIKGVSKRMRKVVETFNFALFKGRREYGDFGKTALQGWADAADCLDKILNSCGGFAPMKTWWGKITKKWLEFEAKYDMCVNVSGGIDLTPLDVERSNMYPNPLTPDPLDWEFYNHSVSQIRGGTKRQFTSPSYLIRTCPFHPANPSSKDFLKGGKLYRPPQKVVKTVRILSDGTCASTCSEMVTRQYLDGLATVITYGGIVGQPMDISSVNGVGSIDWQNPVGDGLWRTALKSFLDKNIWYPEVTPTSWPFMPIPLAMHEVSITQRAQVARALGPNALPREWYRLPSQHHLEYYTRKRLNQNPENYKANDQHSLDALIHLYMEANLKPVLPFKPFQ